MRKESNDQMQTDRQAKIYMMRKERKGASEKTKSGKMFEGSRRASNRPFGEIALKAKCFQPKRYDN